MLTASLVTLGLLAVPAADIDLLFPSTSTQLPSGEPVRETVERVEAAFGSGSLTPMVVVTRDDPQAVRRAVAAERGVARAAAPVPLRDGWSQVAAVAPAEVNSSAARQVVQDVRGALARERLRQTFVGGQTAEGLDLTDRVTDRMPLVVGIAALVSYLILLAAFRSVVVPFKRSSRTCSRWRRPSA